MSILHRITIQICSRGTWITVQSLGIRGDLVCQSKAYIHHLGNVLDKTFTKSLKADGKINCRILPFFVLDSTFISNLNKKDRVEVDRESALNGDMILMNTTLPDIAQKWLFYAQKAFPTFAFLGKMEIDTFVQPGLVWKDLQHHSGRDVYYGDLVPSVCGPPRCLGLS